jgi:hypothetical protein
MQKYIAVAAAVAVVLGAFVWREEAVSLFAAPGRPAASSSPSLLEGFKVPAITLSSIKDAPVAIEAWNAFDAYRAAAKAHDLAKVRALSYQLSAECEAALADSAQMEKCAGLMDSVVFFTQDFKQADFNRVVYDAKQLVLVTDYLVLPGADEPIKTVIYFVKDPGLKILGIRFCVGVEGEADECVETAPAKRDANGNGWWDDIEQLFKK